MTNRLRVLTGVIVIVFLLGVTTNLVFANGEEESDIGKEIIIEDTIVPHDSPDDETIPEVEELPNTGEVKSSLYSYIGLFFIMFSYMLYKYQGYRKSV